MKYEYDIIPHMKHSILKLLLDIMLSFAVSAAFCVLLQLIVGLPPALLFSLPVLLFPIYLPLNYLAFNIRTFWRQHKYESGSELCITPDMEVPLEIIIHKDVYRILCHVHSITGVKRTWKGITVRGRITTEYIYDAQIGRHDTEDTNCFVIPPYFKDMKGFIQTVNSLITHST